VVCSMAMCGSAWCGVDICGGVVRYRKMVGCDCDESCESECLKESVGGIRLGISVSIYLFVGNVYICQSRRLSLYDQCGNGENVIALMDDPPKSLSIQRECCMSYLTQLTG